MFCPKCGFQVQDSANFCPQCGAQLNTGPQLQSSPDVQKAKKVTPNKRPFWKNCLIIIGVFLLILIVFVIIGTISSSGKKSASVSKLTGTPAQTRTPKLSATPKNTPTVTPTPEPTIPPFCKDVQTELISMRSVLDADEHPYPEMYDAEKNQCIYSLRNPDSFLLSETVGYLTLTYADGKPWAGIVEIYYKDNADTREMITDWGAITYSYVDKSTDLLTAYQAVKQAESIGFYVSDTHTVGAELKRDTMAYQIGVFDNVYLTGSDE